METVTFQCGHCKNLMAVETSFLGQQVRCPHCQQVVLVPAPSQESAGRSQESAQGSEGRGQESAIPGAPPQTPDPELEPAPATPASNQAAPPVEISPDLSLPMPPQPEEESILAASEGTSEALFGDSQAPVVEMPSQATLISPPAGDAPDQTSIPAESAIGTSEASGAPVSSSTTELFSSRDVLINQAETPASIPSAGDGPKDWDAGLAAELPIESPGAELSRQVARRAKAESMLAAYLLIFLIPYAIFMTIVAGYFYWRMQQMPHPLEMLKDLGDNPPAKRGTSSVIDIIPADTNLPSKLQVALGQRIRLGDLEVIPKKVERRRIVYCSENQHVQPQESDGDALVLTLQLRNVSEGVFFTPSDPFFDRQWKEDSGAAKPYSFLEMGSQRFFGGPIRRSPRGRGAPPREFIQGQENDNQVLKPGEERTTVVCTDPGNRDILAALNRYQGPIIWRVQLRRGLLAVGDREYSATAVIGVVFYDKDITYQSPPSTVQ